MRVVYERLVYEDEWLLAIDKPAGLVVHPTYKNKTDTLLDSLFWYARDWPSGQRPSIVGRLDRLTSGLVLVAKTTTAHAALQRAMADLGCEKVYLAAVHGTADEAGTIDAPLRPNPSDRRRVIVSADGSPSVTRFVRLAHTDSPDGPLSLLQCTLITGRRHQIRVHVASRGWPIVGDEVYGDARTRDMFPRQALHAWRLTLTHPGTNAPLSIEAPLPEDLQKLLTATGLSRGVMV